MNPEQLLNELTASLARSDAAQRKAWATSILENQIDLHELLSLLGEDRPVATRFLWLLSGVGEQAPEKLLQLLPLLLRRRAELNHLSIEHSLARYWLIAGVPEENEGEAIDLLFSWLSSSQLNDFVKSNSMLVLHRLCDKYPDLQNELRICLEDQLERTGVAFQKTARKILQALPDS